MASSSGGKPKEISLGENFGDVTVSVNGVRLEISVAGDAVIHTEGEVSVESDPDESRFLELGIEPANDARKEPAEIDLGREFGDVAVRAHGVRVEVRADGRVHARTDRAIRVYGNGCTLPSAVATLEAVSLGDAERAEQALRKRGRVDVDAYLQRIEAASLLSKPVAPLTPPPRQPRGTTDLQIGDAMPDGTKYAGISPDTGRPMYALPADAKLTMKWKEAMEYAATFEGHGPAKGTFRLATERELNVLFQNRAKIGGFMGVSMSRAWTCAAGWYWSSKEFGDFRNAGTAWAVRFDGMACGPRRKSEASSVRLVRS